MKKITFKGRVLEVMTIQELAQTIGRSVKTVYKYEERGILPLANLRGKPSISKNGKRIPGRRLYTTELASKLKVIFSRVSQGVEIEGETKRLIAVAFQEERQKYID